MRRASVVVVVAVALAAAAGTAQASRHGDRRGARTTPAARTVRFELVSRVTNARLVDNAPAGASAGDVLVFTEDLLDARGRAVGRDAAVCTRLFDETSLCTGVYVLPRGHVMVQLLQPGPTGTYTQAIVGGTGRYARATGTVVVAQSSAGDRFAFRIRLGATGKARRGPPARGR